MPRGFFFATLTAMPVQLHKVAALIFGSGLCVLIYQVAWLREFRHIFGVSTAASAAVLAVFMAGLGLGSWILGPRADSSSRPLLYYARLELGVGLLAAATPILLWLAREFYYASGGIAAWGQAPSTVVRLVLAGLVLIGPTFLMGGTLPAAVRAVVSPTDKTRLPLAWLYGANTLGAVVGTLLATFLLLEVLGTRSTLWVGALTNLLVAVMARAAARTMEAVPPDAVPQKATAGADPMQAQARAHASPPWLVLVAAFLVGGLFFLMELVWYRMLGPILGGTVFTFGMILATALLGIGLGGFGYVVFFSRTKPTVVGFAVTCLLEAAFIALPFYLGDQLAMIAMLLRSMGALGFYGLVLVWLTMTSIIVLPAAFVAGVQFPLLIALLGRGRRAVGRHLGLAYAANTAGAVTGSLAGGFGLLPVLGAPGCWRAVVVALAALAVAAILWAGRGAKKRGRGARFFALWRPVLAATLPCALVSATGPTALWRHTPIGAGRADKLLASRNDLEQWARARRRQVEWEKDGVESSVALLNANAYALAINGKSDGNARGDAPTQVMLGLVSAILHHKPESALVIGLGTGSSAGWLGVVPSIKRVVSLELEPAVLEAARACAPVNQNVLTNPKVEHITGDAREFLNTQTVPYDLIVSEPSNPYRAGIASLLTVDFYRIVAERLKPGGIFSQWLQAYEVEARTIRTMYTTLGAVFPFVQTWQTRTGDLLFIAAKKPPPLTVARLRTRVAEQPFASALNKVWLTSGLEGFLSRFVANAAWAQLLAAPDDGELNTDDQTLVEFSYARVVGRRPNFSIKALRRAARKRSQHRPQLPAGEAELIDWARVDEEAQLVGMYEEIPPTIADYLTPAARHRLSAVRHYAAGRYAAAVDAWRAQPAPPLTRLQLRVVAGSLAHTGNDQALSHLAALRDKSPVEADLLLAHYKDNKGDLDGAVEVLARAFTAFRTDPWPGMGETKRGLALALALGKKQKKAAARLFTVLAQPFAVKSDSALRLRTRLELLTHFDAPKKACVTALSPLEPHVPWEPAVLKQRFDCYRQNQHPLTHRAAQDVDRFWQQASESVEMLLQLESR